MKVVLLEDVRKVGKKGDVVNVSDGYGQNFLIKNKLAVKETAGAKKILEQQKEEARLQDIENKKNAEELKEKIEGKYVIYKNGSNFILSNAVSMITSINIYLSPLISRHIA